MASLKYPNIMIDSKTDWLSITAYTYKSGSSLINSSTNLSEAILTSGAGEQIPGASFILPIPSNIQDGNSVTYGDDKLNNFTAQGLSVVQGAMTANILEKGLDSLTDVYNKASSLITGAKGADLQNIVMKSLAAEAVSIFGGNVSIDQLLARESGTIMNPNMELLFNGVTLRTFRFSFKMTPRDDAESDNVKAIIRAFKKNMAPIGNTGENFLSTPNVFKLAYKQGNKDHPFLHKFKDCALTDMSVNYTGENVYATYHDGTPISMVMDLTFKELVPIYQGDYEEKTDSEGKVISGAPGGVGY